jgi:hypothetical protein
LVEVSIGAAVAADRGVDAMRLISQADVALYRIKAARPPRARVADRWSTADQPPVGNGRADDGRREIPRRETAWHDRNRAGEAAEQGLDQHWVGWADPAWSTIRADPVGHPASRSGQRA